jgi:hypothetical protein
VEKPSGPDTLSGGRALITYHISSSKKCAQMPDKSVWRRSSRSSFMRRALDGGATMILSKKSSVASALASSDTAKRPS